MLKGQQGAGAAAEMRCSTGLTKVRLIPVLETNGSNLGKSECATQAPRKLQDAC